MRRFLFAAVVCTLIALPLAAQNTDIESLSGLQFNFGNPGARSLGMGGAFLGLADDASAAEANPAGLTILRKPEITLEGRNYQEQQVFTTSGTFPDLQRTAFSHYSQRIDATFASVVYPTKHFTFGAYYHEPLRNEGTGQVVPVRNQFTGEIKTDVPNFFLPVDANGNATGGPITCGCMPGAAAEESIRLPRVHDSPVPQPRENSGEDLRRGGGVQGGQILVRRHGALAAFQRDRLHVPRHADVRFLQHLRAGHERHPHEQRRRQRQERHHLRRRFQMGAERQVLARRRLQTGREVRRADVRRHGNYQLRSTSKCPTRPSTCPTSTAPASLSARFRF